MPDIVTIIVMTLAAGVCIPAGGVVARFEHIRPNWLENELRHFIIALGGGILMGAVTFVLVPEGIASLDQSMFAVPVILTGGFVFFIIERYLGLRRRESPQLMGMVLDYIPEAIALGGLAASSSASTILLALLIGLQNLPEGFNAYRELRIVNKSKKVLLTMSILALLGPIAGLSGYFFLSENVTALGCIMLFSSGGILYLIFQDIAPQSHLKKHWAPPLGAVLGFCFALFCDMLVNG